jgi:hypothetical protein
MAGDPIRCSDNGLDRDSVIVHRRATVGASHVNADALAPLHGIGSKYGAHGSALRRPDLDSGSQIIGITLPFFKLG